MRKVLFWILIIVLLFLVVVLGVGFYNNKTPLTVLKGWFGVEETVQVNTTLSNKSEEDKKVDVKEEIQQQVEASGGPTGNESNTLSDEDKKAAKQLIDGLIVK